MINAEGQFKLDTIYDYCIMGGQDWVTRAVDRILNWKCHVQAGAEVDKARLLRILFWIVWCTPVGAIVPTLNGIRFVAPGIPFVARHSYR